MNYEMAFFLKALRIRYLIVSWMMARCVSKKKENGHT